jgi:hypothetical protein
MIRTLLAQTNELDEVDLAMVDILAQLDLDNNLLANSVGILTCYMGFVETGIVSALVEKLPFEVAGINTIYNTNARGKHENMTLSLAVLTSNDISFAVGLSDSLLIDQRGPISEMYRETAARLPGKPSLILGFGPVLPNVVGDGIVRHLDNISGGVPLFGGLAADYTTQLRDPRVIYHEQSYGDRLVTILIHGDIQPKFRSSYIPQHKIIQRKAIVTDAEANILKSVNGMPVMKYLETMGLCSYGYLEGSHTVPIMISRADGSPSRATTIHSQTPEGFIILCSEAPVDSIIGIGALDERDIIEAARYIASEARMERADVIFFVSCLSRSIILGLDYLSEIEAIHATLGDNTPYFLTYSAGEFCPVRNPDGNWTNEYHNMALTMCAF